MASFYQCAVYAIIYISLLWGYCVMWMLVAGFMYCLEQVLLESS
ncbi:hypothetical protein SALWKB12_1484 [Snodgrassella communis]|nr:hypothetical protein SALWKB12_1484 [Snodgrassella communis]